MENSRFDQLTLLISTTRSRREVLRLLAAGFVSAVVVGRTARPARAALCEPRAPRPGYTPTANGCGPDGYDWFVPDVWKDAEFTGACSRHDVCYGTCNRDRSDCDDRFLRGLKKACRRAYHEDTRRDRRLYGECVDRAYWYYTAVSEHGQEAYEDAQAAACICCDTVTCQPGETQDPATCGCQCPGASSGCAKYEVCRDGGCVAVCPAGGSGVHNGSFIACEVNGGIQCHCNSCGTVCRHSMGEACCSNGCQYVVTTCADHGH